MNSATIVCFIIGILVELPASWIVARNKRGTPLSRALWMACWPFFMLAVGLSDYLTDVTIWLRVPIAIVLGYVVAFIWSFISALFTEALAGATRGS